LDQMIKAKDMLGYSIGIILAVMPPRNIKLQ
jgi:hypothetical protein